MSELEDLARHQAAGNPPPDSLESLAQSKARLAGASPKSYQHRLRHPPSAPSYSFICPNPNCGYAGHRVRRPRGNMAVCFILLLLGGLPGILYAVITSGYDYYCPRCNLRLHSDIG